MAAKAQEPVDLFSRDRVAVERECVLDRPVGRFVEAAASADGEVPGDACPGGFVEVAIEVVLKDRVRHARSGRHLVS